MHWKWKLLMSYIYRIWLINLVINICCRFLNVVKIQAQNVSEQSSIIYKGEFAVHDWIAACRRVGDSHHRRDFLLKWIRMQGCQISAHIPHPLTAPTASASPALLYFLPKDDTEFNTNPCAGFCLEIISVWAETCWPPVIIWIMRSLE